MFSRLAPAEVSARWRRTRFSYYTVHLAGNDYAHILREIHGFEPNFERIFLSWASLADEMAPTPASEVVLDIGSLADDSGYLELGRDPRQPGRGGPRLLGRHHRRRGLRTTTSATCAPASTWTSWCSRATSQGGLELSREVRPGRPSGRIVADAGDAGAQRQGFQIDDPDEAAAGRAFGAADDRHVLAVRQHREAARAAGAAVRRGEDEREAPRPARRRAPCRRRRARRCCCGSRSRRPCRRPA